MKQMVSGRNSPQIKKYPQINIASAHIHIQSINPAKFEKNPMDVLVVVDKGSPYMYMQEMISRVGEYPPPKKNVKIPKLK